jgi:hypothetical protein
VSNYSNAWQSEFFLSVPIQDQLQHFIDMNFGRSAFKYAQNSVHDPAPNCSWQLL